MAGNRLGRGSHHHEGRREGYTGHHQVNLPPLGRPVQIDVDIMLLVTTDTAHGKLTSSRPYMRDQNARAACTSPSRLSPTVEKVRRQG